MCPRWLHGYQIHGELVNIFSNHYMNVLIFFLTWGYLSAYNIILQSNSMRKTEWKTKALMN